VEFSNVITVNINNVDVTDQGKKVYEAIMRTGARSTDELLEHLPMTEGEIDFMLAHLYRHDLIKVEYEYESPFEPFRGIGELA
jgi:predicted transcriptional regulator